MEVKDFKKYLDDVSPETEIRFFFWAGHGDPYYLEILDIYNSQDVKVCFKQPKDW